MNRIGPWLLVVVEGPSEVGGDEERRGAVTKLVARVFGTECAANSTVTYWRQVSGFRSPRRQQRTLRGFAAKAEFLAKLGAPTAYGTVLVVDNDRDTGQDRLDELQKGVKSAGLKQRSATGVAMQMLEAWLLADPELLSTPLPAGSICETLWGAKNDPTSNYPKHVLRRCVLEPRSWTLDDAIEEWEPERARSNAGSLDAFIEELRSLAAQYD